MDASDPRYPMVCKLMDYWLEHPRAADTQEGIRKWWLREETASIDHLEEALEWLRDHHIIVVYTASDGRFHYRLADEHMTRPC